MLITLLVTPAQAAREPCGVWVEERLKVVWGKSFDGEALDDTDLQTFSDALDCLKQCREKRK